MKQISIIGAPGTGKTYSLVSIYDFLTHGNRNNIIDEYKIDNIIHEKYDEDEVIFITFTTSAVDVLKQRNIDYAYTMHSYIARVMYRNKMLKKYFTSGDTFARVMLREGYGYDFRDRFSSHASNIAELKYSYYFNTYYDKCDDEILDIIRMNERADIAERIETYVNYIRNNNFIDYVQLLREFYFNANKVTKLVTEEAMKEPRVLILDEAQDFSALQFAVVQKLIEIHDFDYIIAAGDPNQSIYSFQGAKAELFIDFIKNSDYRIVLKQSFRLPKRVYAQSEIITRFLGTRWNFKPRDNVGKVDVRVVSKQSLKKLDQQLIDEVHKIIMQSLVNNKSVFVLARTNKQVRELERKLFNADYKFARIKTSESFTDLIDSIALLKTQNTIDERLYDLIVFSDEDARAVRDKLILKYTDIQILRELNKKNNDDEMIQKLRKIIAEKVDELLTDDEREILKKYVENDKKHIVYIDTMHASKGEEADVVIVLDYVNEKIKKSIDNDHDALREEARVLYVALTRAREELYIFTTKSKYSVLTRVM